MQGVRGAVAPADTVRAVRSRRQLARAMVPWLWLSPCLIILALLLLYPLVYSLYLSFHSYNVTQSQDGPRFIGLNNYIRLFTTEEFWQSFRATMIFAVGTVALEFLLGLGIAVALDTSVRARGLVRTLCILPMMLTPVVVGLMWKFLWAPKFGFINYAIGLAGIPPVEWFSQPLTAMGALMVTEVWQHTSFVILVLLAALQALPDEPYESAKIDGANAWQAFWNITLPLLMPAILVVLIFRTIFALRSFDLIWVLTGGGPVNSTLTLSVYIYRVAFRYWELGFASAVAWVMLLMAMATCLAYLAILRPKTD